MLYLNVLRFHQDRNLFIYDKKTLACKSNTLRLPLSSISLHIRIIANYGASGAVHG